MPSPIKRATRRLLDGVHLPIAIYLGTVGIFAAVDPGLVDRTVAPWLAYIWAASLIVGMVMILIGVAAEETRMESVGHAFHVFGLLLLAAIEISVIGFADIVALAALIGVPVLRMRVLRRARAAEREARRIAQEASRLNGDGSDA